MLGFMVIVLFLKRYTMAVIIALGTGSQKGAPCPCLRGKRYNWYEIFKNQKH